MFTFSSSNCNNNNDDDDAQICEFISFVCVSHDGDRYSLSTRRFCGKMPECERVSTGRMSSSLSTAPSSKYIYSTVSLKSVLFLML